jgi:integrase
MKPEHVKLVVRHSSTCPHKAEGITYEYCQCRKSLLIYHEEDHSQERMATKERVWSKAVEFRQAYLNRNDPALQRELAELDERRAEDELKGKAKDDRVTIDRAVAAYINNMRSARRAHGTIVNAQSLLGYVDPKSSEIVRSGKFKKWLSGLIIKPKYLTDLTPDWIDQFVATWSVGDTTENGQRQRIRAFFKFCIKRRWLERNPADALERVKIKRGNRTVAFSSEEYRRILKACKIYDPRIPSDMQQAWKLQLTTFTKLLRHSGMDLVDACQFETQMLDRDVLVYRRQKTGIQSWPILLPSDLVIDLNAVCESSGSPTPFRTTTLPLKEDCRKWRWKLQQVFKSAGITSVKTDVGMRPPHPKQFRDTFAIENLNSGVPLSNVSKMFGHKNTKMTEDYYLPKSKSTNTAHVAILRKTLAKNKTSYK